MKKLCLLLLTILFAQIAMAVPLAITTLGVASSTPTTAIITWSTTGTSAAADTRVSYTCGGVPNAYIDGARVTSHSATLTGLQPGVVCTYTASSQSATETATGTVASFSTCQPNSGKLTAVKATLYSFYAYGAYTATWHDLSGIGTTPTQCGVAITTPVSGTLDINGNLTVSLPDVNQVTPSPGAWTIAFSSFASTGSVSVDISPTGQNFDASTTIQAQVSSGNKGPVGGNSGGGPSLPVSIANGGTGTGSTLTGIVRGSASAMTAAELSGDATTSGSNAVSVVKVNGSTPGGTCTNQFARSLNSSAVPTCATVSLTADVSGITPVANGGTASATGFTSAGVVGLFTGCSGTLYLGADGACHAAGGGTNTPTAVPVAASPAISYIGMISWWRADFFHFSDATTASNPANNTSVTYWQDSSGYSNTLVNNSGTCTYNTGLINSQPGLTFSSCYLQSSAGPGAWTGAITVFVVFKNTGPACGTLLTGPGQVNWRTDCDSSKELSMNQSGVGGVGTGTAAADANWHQANFSCDTGSNPVFRLDRAADATISGAACNFNGSRVGINGPGSRGGADLFVGAMAEMIIYGRVLSSTEKTTVETYLNTKYGL